MANDFFMVKFDLHEDRRNKVMRGGPWMIFDHHFVVSTWSAKFISSEATVIKMLAWICIPSFNVAFYYEGFLFFVSQVIETPIRMDVNNLEGNRGRFARICVELDLTKPIIGKVMIEGYWYKIEYEGFQNKTCQNSRNQTKILNRIIRSYYSLSN